MFGSRPASRLVAAALTLTLAGGLGGCVVPFDELNPLKILDFDDDLGDPSPLPSTPPSVFNQPNLNQPNANQNRPVTRLRAKMPALDLKLGDERPFNALVTDQGGQIPSVALNWLSSNPSVVTVNPVSGDVKALANGEATISASLRDNPGVRAQIEVRVAEVLSVRNIVVTPSTSSLETGSSVSLAAAVSMADGTINANVKWASSDGSVATVDPGTGEVEALRPGTVTIEAIYAADTRFKGLAILTITQAKARPATPTPTQKPTPAASAVTSPAPTSEATETPTSGPSPTPTPVASPTPDA